MKVSSTKAYLYLEFNAILLEFTFELIQQVFIEWQLCTNTVLGVGDSRKKRPIKISFHESCILTEKVEKQIHNIISINDDKF